MTHLICEPCEAREAIADDSVLSEQHLVASYYTELRALVRHRLFVEASVLVARAPSLKIRASDLVVGLLQPLVQVLSSSDLRGLAGSGRLSFGPSPIERLIEQVLRSYPELQERQTRMQPDAWLVCFPGETVQLASRLLSLGLSSRQVATHVCQVTRDARGLPEGMAGRAAPVWVFALTSVDALERLASFGFEIKPREVYPGEVLFAIGKTAEPCTMAGEKLTLTLCRDAMEALRCITQMLGTAASLNPGRLMDFPWRASGNAKPLAGN